jgi:hypothetical protein
MHLPQANEDVRCAPGRMLLMQEQRLSDGFGRGCRLGRHIRGSERLVAIDFQLATKVANGPWAELKFTGDGSGRGASFRQRPNLSPES